MKTICKDQRIKLFISCTKESIPYSTWYIDKAWKEGRDQTSHHSSSLCTCGALDVCVAAQRRRLFSEKKASAASGGESTSVTRWDSCDDSEGACSETFICASWRCLTNLVKSSALHWAEEWAYGSLYCFLTRFDFSGDEEMAEATFESQGEYHLSVKT